MSEDAPDTRMTYGNYLQLDKLLSLQSGPKGHTPAPSNHEMHFIVVHQAFELWFKQINRELEEALSLLNVEEVDEKNIPVIVSHLERCSEIFRRFNYCQFKRLSSYIKNWFLSKSLPEVKRANVYQTP